MKQRASSIVSAHGTMCKMEQAAGLKKRSTLKERTVQKKE